MIPLIMLCIDNKNLLIMDSFREHLAEEIKQACIDTSIFRGREISVTYQIHPIFIVPGFDSGSIIQSTPGETTHLAVECRF
jgi:hypothetical protein